MIRVLVVDDHDLVRDTVSAVLRDEGSFDVVGACADGRQAVQMFTTRRPDVVLMDLSMPVMGGVDATRELIALDPAARVIVLTAARLSREIDEAIAAGALSFVSKHAGVVELIRAVKAVAAEERVPPTSLTPEPAKPDGGPTRRRWIARRRDRS